MWIIIYDLEEGRLEMSGHVSQHSWALQSQKSSWPPHLSPELSLADIPVAMELAALDDDKIRHWPCYPSGWSYSQQFENWILWLLEGCCIINNYSWGCLHGGQGFSTPWKAPLRGWSWYPSVQVVWLSGHLCKYLIMLGWFHSRPVIGPEWQIVDQETKV